MGTLDDYEEAIAAEQSAWNALQGHFPGTPEFDPMLWSAWIQAAHRADVALWGVKVTKGAPPPDPGPEPVKH
jgi:hypothetical protein